MQASAAGVGDCVAADTVDREVVAETVPELVGDMRANYPDGACAADIKACYLRLPAPPSGGYVLLTSVSTTFLPVGDDDAVRLALSIEEWQWMDLWWALPRAEEEGRES